MEKRRCGYQGTVGHFEQLAQSFDDLNAVLTEAAEAFNAWEPRRIIWLGEVRPAVPDPQP